MTPNPAPEGFDPWNLLHIAWMALLGVLVFFGKRALRDVEQLKDKKADKEDIASRFDESAETIRELVKKVDSNQQETVRLLLQIAGGRQHGN